MAHACHAHPLIRRGTGCATLVSLYDTIKLRKRGATSSKAKIQHYNLLQQLLMPDVLVQAPAPDAAPPVTAESIPVVTISYALTDLTLDSFTPDLKQELVNAIIDALPASSNVDVYLTNIQSGSVTFDTVISFLDGNTDTAQALSDSVAASATVSLTALSTKAAGC